VATALGPTHPLVGVAEGRVPAQPATSAGASSSRTGYAERARRRPMGREDIGSSWQTDYGGEGTPWCIRGLARPLLTLAVL
jgi:hypothetical protein